MSARVAQPLPGVRTLPGPTYLVGRVLHRKYLVYRNSWIAFLTGFLEPVFYLFSIGIGVGKLVEAFSFHDHAIGYADFVAPGMLAAAAMNGAVFDATFNFFHHLKYDKVFIQWLATPVTTTDIARGEVSWTLVRGGVYSGAFILVMLAMGLLHSWWALLALPGSLLITGAFASVGMALTTYMRSWQDFDYVTLATLPMLLFSATFYPLTAYPAALQWLIELTPLYRGAILMRELTTGYLTWESAASVVYLVALTILGVGVVRRRLARLLLS